MCLRCFGGDSVLKMLRILYNVLQIQRLSVVWKVNCGLTICILWDHDTTYTLSYMQHSFSCIWCIQKLLHNYADSSVKQEDLFTMRPLGVQKVAKCGSKSDIYASKGHGGLHHPQCWHPVWTSLLFQLMHSHCQALRLWARHPTPPHCLDTSPVTSPGLHTHSVTLSRAIIKAERTKIVDRVSQEVIF